MTEASEVAGEVREDGSALLVGEFLGKDPFGQVRVVRHGSERKAY